MSKLKRFIYSEKKGYHNLKLWRRQKTAIDNTKGAVTFLFKRNVILGKKEFAKDKWLILILPTKSLSTSSESTTSLSAYSAFSSPLSKLQKSTLGFFLVVIWLVFWFELPLFKL